MEKLNKFFKIHGTKVISVLLFIILIRSCSTSGELRLLKKEVKELQVKVSDLPTKTDLEIEGLKSEKRMIQASDRKILDVQRQTEIDNEIKKLQNK
jgi:hypothetical protein